MWGTQYQVIDARGHARFIPTHVGNTDCYRVESGEPPVHPHACGEHVVMMALIAPATGSSPRMWGTRSRTPLALHRFRFIPTHVGNTEEHAMKEKQIPGSSPRMWGTRRQRDGDLPGDRFIPTHVGNTCT